MKRLQHIFGMSTAAALALVLTLATTSCTEEFPLEPGLLSFQVTVVDPGHVFGSENAPVPYVSGAACPVPPATCGDGNVCYQGTVCAHRMVVDIQAIGRDGNPWPFFTGDVSLRVTPGELLSAPTIRIQDGVALGAEIVFVKGRGKTHVWVEDDGYVPHDRQFGQCSDGIDNDNNGLVDMADPGCQALDDDLEAPVGLATGVTQTVTFDDPKIYDLQAGALLQRSPLRGEQVQVTSGTLVVTNILASGFYVVDLQDNVPRPGETVPRYNNGLFVFTFSKPEGINYGDVLCGVSGSVQDFVGATQLSFPSFTAYRATNTPRECDGFDGLDPDAEVPDPQDLTAPLLDELEGGLGGTEYFSRVYANSLHLERFEGSLGTFTNVAVSTRFISCDRNDNGAIDSGTDEFTCRNECQDDAMCTDLESYFEFNQYAGVTDGKKKIYGSTLLATAFSPLDIGFIGDEDASGRCERTTTAAGFIEYNCAPIELESMTGSVRQIYLCGETSANDRCDLQFWVLDPRFDSDVVLKENQ